MRYRIVSAQLDSNERRRLDAAIRIFIEMLLERAEATEVAIEATAQENPEVAEPAAPLVGITPG